MVSEMRLGQERPSGAAVLRSAPAFLARRCQCLACVSGKSGEITISWLLPVPKAALHTAHSRQQTADSALLSLGTQFPESLECETSTPEAIFNFNMPLSFSVCVCVCGSSIAIVLMDFSYFHCDYTEWRFPGGLVASWKPVMLDKGSPNGKYPTSH